jgi:hypothetical protein
MAVPILAAACTGLALVLGAGAGESLAAAAAGAAITHALRTLAGNGPAALVGAGAAALVGVALIAQLPGSHALAQLAIAAAAWTIAELARPSPAPYVALAPAILAAILEPGFVAVVAIAGVRLVPSPTRWLIAVPILGACAVVLAVVAGVAEGGALGSLGEHWFRQPRAADHQTLSRVGDALGPLVTVAAIAGLATLARVHLASLAIVACAIGTLLVDLRAGTPTAATLGLAALCAGAGIGRLAGMIRLPSGQAIAAATFGFVLLAPAVIERVL